MDPSYNNSFGSFNSGQDIVLNDGGTEKRSKKKILIISLIIAFLIIIVIGLVVVLSLNSVEGEIGSVDEYKEQYVSLLVNGEISDDISDMRINVGELEESENKNIYNIPRFGDPLSEENKNYYAEIKNTLEKMKRATSKGQYSDEDEAILDFLINNSLDLLSFYFISTALVDTDASYNYYLENRNFDGFLSEYGYPITGDYNGMMGDFKLMIEGLQEAKDEYYNTISGTNCLKADGVDYECLNNNASFDEASMKVLNWQAGLNNYTDQMLNIIISNANRIRDLLGESANNE